MVMFPWNVAMITDPTHADDFSAQLSYSVDEGRPVALTETTPLTAIVNVLGGGGHFYLHFLSVFLLLLTCAPYDDVTGRKKIGQ